MKRHLLFLGALISYLAFYQNSAPAQTPEASSEMILRINHRVSCHGRNAQGLPGYIGKFQFSAPHNAEIRYNVFEGQAITEVSIPANLVAQTSYYVNNINHILNAEREPFRSLLMLSLARNCLTSNLTSYTLLPVDTDPNPNAADYWQKMALLYSVIS